MHRFFAIMPYMHSESVSAQQVLLSCMPAGLDLEFISRMIYCWVDLLLMVKGFSK